MLPTGTGEPDAIAYDDVPAQAPRLVINYTPSGGSLTTYDMRIAQSSDDAGEGFDDSDNNNTTIDIGKGDFVGMRFQGVNLASGVTIDSAFLYFDVENDDKADGDFAVDVFAENSGVPATYSNGVLGDLTTRGYTSAFVNWGATVVQAQTDVKSPDLKNVIQEVINNQGAVADIAFLLAITGTGDISALAYETSPTQAFRLEIFGETPGNGAYNLLMDIDIGTLPATASMTTDNVETVQFTADGQIECGNTFGFDLGNPPPIAVDDSETTERDVPIPIDVLVNDYDPQGETITLTNITSSPNQGGTATINTNGTPGDPTDDYVDYTPPLGFTGVETFEYSICDDGSPIACDTALVTITITTPPDYSPTAVDDYETTVEETPVMVDVQNNDIDPTNTILFYHFSTKRPT